MKINLPRHLIVAGLTGLLLFALGCGSIPFISDNDEPDAQDIAAALANATRGQKGDSGERGAPRWARKRALPAHKAS